MGRHTTGDIETKMWFAIQSSDAASRFGVVPHQSDHLYYFYYFSKEDLPKVIEELQEIEQKLGDNLNIISKFFEENNTYNNRIMEEWGLPISTWDEYKIDYADYTLGIKIRDCIQENGHCEFEVEL